MSARFVPALTLIAFLAAGSAGASEHPDFTENVDRPQRIVLLPVQSSITRGRVTDAEPLIKETAVLERALAREAARALERLGYELDIDVVSAEAIAADESLLMLMDEARDRANESLVEASRDPKGVWQGRFTIDDAALPLAAHAQAEGLLVLHSQSFIVSKGSKTLAAFMNPFNLASATRTRTAVIGALYDTRDGQLLTLVTGRDVGPVLKKPDEVARQVIESAFREFPAAGTSKRAKPKHRQAAPARELEAIPSVDEGEATLAAFEELAAARDAPVDRDSAPGSATDPVTATDTGTGTGTGTDPVAATDTDTETETDPVPATDTGPPTAQPDGEPPTDSRAESDGQQAAIPDPRMRAAADEAATIQRLLDTPPSLRAEPSLQVVFLGDVGPTAVAVQNMSSQTLRISVAGGAFERLERGQLLERAVKPGSHRLLIVHAEEDRELARAVLVVREGRVALAELWPAPP